MRSTPIAALVLGGFVSLGIAACGSSGSSPSSQPTTQAARHASTQAAQHTSTAPAKKAGGLTPPGTKLGFNQDATVGWVPPSQFSSAGGHAAIPMQVDVEGIEKGTLADFKNVQLNNNEKGATPFYVKVRLTKLGAGKSGVDDNPALTFRAIDDRGQAQANVTFLGDFQRCNDALPPNPFPQGKTFKTCLTYLIPGGGSIDKIAWNDGPAMPNSVSDYYEHPVIWGAGA
jgi:hypothetical protein